MATGGVVLPQDDVNNGVDIGFLVQHVYKDLIIKHVRVGSIIGRMLPPEEFRVTVNSIIASENAGNVLRATREFLDYLADREDNRDYLLFAQLLEQEDYAYLSKLLRGEPAADPETHIEHCRLLEFFSKDIGEKVDFNLMYEKLLEDSWMDREDYELLKCLANNNGNGAAMRWTIYYVLPRRKEYWIKQFLQILRDLNYNDLADHITGETDDATVCGSEVGSESIVTDDDDDDDKSLVGMNIVHATGNAYDSMNNLDEPRTPFTYIEKRNLDHESSMKMKRTDEWAEKSLEVHEILGCSDTDSIPSSVEDNTLEIFDTNEDVTRELIAVREKQIKPLESRRYQEELARYADEGRNVIIIAPTGSGKTVVAVRIMQKHLEMKNGEGKIAFFANEVTLVDQQHEMCRGHLESKLKTIQIVGETKDKSRIPVPDLIAQNDIIFMTPQIIVDCLSKKHLESLSVFSLLVFDECHNVSAKHPSNNIMAAYLDMKLNGEPCLPQVVGLTASVGTGRKKVGSEIGGAVDHIKGLCARLDAGGGLVTVRENKESLAEYTKHVETAIKRTNERLDDPFKQCVVSIMDKIEEKLLEKHDHLILHVDEEIKSSMDKSTMAYRQWLSRMYYTILPRIQNTTIRKPLLSYIEHLTVYNKALVINEDCRGRDAMICITEFQSKFYPDQRSSRGEDGWLRDLFLANKTRLEHESRAHVNRNPKLLLLKLEIVEKLKKDPRSKILVLVKTRDLAKALLRWMKETGDLNQLNPVIVTGCGAPSDKGGMTRAEQIKAVKSFKWGVSHAAIGTSVAEEGMDFAQCKRVIRYDYVSNEIGMVQARGRASRADDGDYCLITRSADMANREQNNFRLELVMNEAVEKIQAEIENNPRKFVDSIEELQKKEKLDRDIKKKQKQIQTCSKDPNAHRIHCYKCSTFICLSTDIRVLNNSHHMVLTPDIGNLVTEIAHKKPITFDNIMKCSKIHCKRSDCRMDWGVAVIYRDAKFAVLTPKGLLFYPPHGKQYHRKSWKDVPFSCKELSEEDLLSYESSFEEIPTAASFSEQ